MLYWFIIEIYWLVGLLDIDIVVHCCSLMHSGCTGLVAPGEAMRLRIAAARKATHSVDMKTLIVRSPCFRLKPLR